MKRSLTIFAAGVLLAFAVYGALFWAGTASRRELLRSNAPELLWLKQEFKLSETEFQRVCRLHEAYLPHCVEMCKRIDAKNAELRNLLSATNTLTPELDAKLSEAAQLRLDCQKAMLKHFYEVSQTMPPDQGKRYLAWVQQKTFLPHYGMTPGK